MKAIIAYGSTTPGKTNWKLYQNKVGALYLDVDTSEAGFTSTPKYITSFGGNSQHWDVVGAGSIYTPTPQGFRVYIKPSNESAKKLFNPKSANTLMWHLNWMGIGSVT